MEAMVFTFTFTHMHTHTHTSYTHAGWHNNIDACQSASSLPWQVSVRRKGFIFIYCISVIECVWRLGLPRSDLIVCFLIKPRQLLFSIFLILSPFPLTPLSHFVEQVFFGCFLIVCFNEAYLMSDGWPMFGFSWSVPCVAPSKLVLQVCYFWRGRSYWRCHLGISKS